MAYEFDLFLSYSRKPSVRGWVKKHFHPVLWECLEGLMPHDPDIFVDWEQETGVRWPSNLGRALNRSRYLVAVWSPPYFRSRWCLAEWQTLKRREKDLGLASDDDPRGLIFPVKLSDGVHFHEEANAAQQCNLSAWNYPDEVFKESLGYLDFRDAVRKLAAEIAAKIDAAPEWDPEWKLVRPEPADPPPSKLPRL